MNRDILAARAEGYVEGRATAQDEMEFLCLARLDQAYQQGRKDQKHHQERVQWLLLGFVVFDAVLAAELFLGVINSIISNLK